MVGFASSVNSSSRKPRLLWRTWTVRALVTAEARSRDRHPSEFGVILVAERALADAFAQLAQIDDPQDHLQRGQCHDRHDRDRCQRLESLSNRSCGHAPALAIRSVEFEHVLVIELQGRRLVFLARKQLPTTSTSMSLPMKQRKASSGVHTIGSPRTLKLVLTSTGHPVAALNAVSSA